MRTLSVLGVVVVLAVASCGDAGESGEPAATPTSANPGPTSTVTRPVAAGPTDAAKAWVGAIGAGDLDRAWALVAPRSRSAIGGRDGLERSRTGLSEGWGAWSSATGVRYSAVRLPDSPRDETWSVVVLDGTVAQEGPPRRTTAALVVRTTNGTSLVDPFVDLGDVEFAPTSGATIPSQPTFEAYVVAARSVWFVVDTRGPERPATEGADGDRQRARLAIGPALEPGHHSLTVVLERDGAIAAHTATYSVSSQSAGATQGCGSVAFTPNSEDAASNIQASGLTCDEARAFVRIAGEHTSSGGPDQVTVEGYRCTRTGAVEDPLPRSSYDCRNGSKRVSFDRT